MNRYTAEEMQMLEKGRLECADVEAMLGDYVDRELPDTLSGRVAEHITHCPHCTKAEGEYRLVIEVAKELPKVEPSDAVKRRLREALNRRLGIALHLDEE